MSVWKWNKHTIIKFLTKLVLFYNISNTRNNLIDDSTYNLWGRSANICCFYFILILDYISSNKILGMPSSLQKTL